MSKTHENPVGEFTPEIDTETGPFKLSLKYKGTSMGYVGVNSNGYCVIVNSESSALTFTTTVKKGVVYYETQYQGNTKYLSVSRRDYVGLYSWRGATGWAQSDGHLISDHNNQALSMYSTEDGYLYAWDAYSVLDVAEV